MTIKRLLAIAFILLCTALAWAGLGTSLLIRSNASFCSLGNAVTDVWGPMMIQPHPVISYDSPGSSSGRHAIQPLKSNISVALRYEPKKKGLLWYRTYLVDFSGDYTIENPTPITQTIYIQFEFPAADASYTNFSCAVNGNPSTESNKTKDGIVDAVTLAPGATGTFAVAYTSRGTDRWSYSFGDATRIRNFHLAMNTNFSEINFPSGTGSSSDRNRITGGWNLVWSYPDVINAQGIGMDMPALLNPGPVASRISFFAPVSLLFLFAVLILVATVQGVNLHPMNYFFLAAGCFAFQLLFAYLVDVVPLLPAFAISAAVSLALVSGYLFLSAGPRFARIAALAQFAYMVLFSYSFFFDGLAGLTITIGAIVTLALLMVATAKVNWAEKFSSKMVTSPAATIRPGRL